MVEIAFVVITVLLAIRLKYENVIILLIFLLPFNDFFKEAISNLWSGGTIFSFWKELVILILFLRTYPHIKRTINKIIVIYFFMIICCSFFFVLGIEYYPPAICFRMFRNMCVVPLLFVICSGLTLSDSFLKKITYTLCIDAIIIGLIGIWEIHGGGRIPVRSFMGDIYADNTIGVFYKVTNFTIMGFDRMCSIMLTPNAFGYFMAFVSSFLLFLLQYQKKLFAGWRYKIIFMIWLFSLFCLLESFCRTAYVMFLFCYLFILYNKQCSKFTKQIIIFGIISILILTLAFFFVPNIESVINGTLSGKEESASDRINNFSSGWTFVSSHPFGHGLGSSENSVKRFVFFSESSFINIITEIGIIGLIIFYLLQLSIYKCICTRRNKSEWTSYSLSLLLMNLLCMISTNIFGTPYIYFLYILMGVCMMKRNTISTQKYIVQ